MQKNRLRLKEKPNKRNKMPSSLFKKTRCRLTIHKMSGLNTISFLKRSNDFTKILFCVCKNSKIKKNFRSISIMFQSQLSEVREKSMSSS